MRKEHPRGGKNRGEGRRKGRKRQKKGKKKAKNPQHHPHHLRLRVPNLGKHKAGFMSDKLSSSLWTGEKKCRCFRTDANELLILGRKFRVSQFSFISMNPYNVSKIPCRDGSSGDVD